MGLPSSAELAQALHAGIRTYMTHIAHMNYHELARASRAKHFLQASPLIPGSVLYAAAGIPAAPLDKDIKGSAPQHHQESHVIMTTCCICCLCHLTCWPWHYQHWWRPTARSSREKRSSSTRWLMALPAIAPKAASLTAFTAGGDMPCSRSISCQRIRLPLRSRK